MTLLLAHISDLHLDGSERATERAGRTVAYLRDLPQAPDALLVSGDIADTPSREEYEEAAGLLDLPFPVIVCPGNHDDREGLRTRLLGEPASAEPFNRVHRVAGAAVLACDSTIPGEDGGRLEPSTLMWINDTLNDLPAGTPALLAFHHPPVRVHHPLPDSMRLGNSDDLAGLLHAHPGVAGILVGHAHTGGATTFAGRPLLLAPGVTWTLRMPWEGEPVADREQPPGVAFHILDEHQRLTTHFRAVMRAGAEV
ncbi:metallophosphoesterase [Nocardiopsis flavescens]|uniref:Calcineurin-like phosphoesterase n=1 Tax=Nocardiopsis flavescens TaxID=758803 RepID=A0A1M6B7K3_9ACTN|nr:metallophosphoesterase [Nocardiopsis flavescens]SHI44695.1 Calcineurin-like phosphoesterase [Nocardiopsis flavescens]